MRWSPLSLAVLVGGLLGMACREGVTEDDLGDEPAGVRMAVGPDGGTLEDTDALGVRLIIPPGALTERVTVQLSRSNVKPEGVNPRSWVYRFEPTGLTFALPARLEMDFMDGQGDEAIFWTTRLDVAAGQLPTTVEGEVAIAAIDHFSFGWVQRALPTGADTGDSGAVDSEDTGGGTDDTDDTDLGDSGDSGGDSGDSAGDSGDSAGDSGDSGGDSGAGDSGAAACLPDSGEPNDVSSELEGFDLTGASPTYTLQGTLDPGAGDVDFFRAIVPAGCSLSVDATYTGADGDLVGRLYASFQGVIQGDRLLYQVAELPGSSGELRMSYDPDQEHAYFPGSVFFDEEVLLRLTTPSTACVAYELTLALDCAAPQDTGTAPGSCDDGDVYEENDFLAQATQTGVTAGGDRFSAASVPLDGATGDADLYAFSLPPLCAVRIVATSTSGDVDLLSMGPLGTPEYLAASVSPRFVDQLGWRDLSNTARTYRVGVFSFQDTCSLYDLDIAVACGAACVVDAQEPNDTPQVATPTQVDGPGETYTASGSTGSASDQDWFAFQVPAECGYRVSLDFADATGDLGLVVLDAARTFHGFADGATDGEVLVGSNPTTAPLDLYAVAFPAQGMCVPYVLDLAIDCGITDCPIDGHEPSEYGDGVVSGLVGGQSATFEGTVTHGGRAETLDVDPFEVTVPVGCSVTARLDYQPSTATPWLGFRLASLGEFAPFASGEAGSVQTVWTNDTSAEQIVEAAVEGSVDGCVQYALELELTCPP